MADKDDDDDDKDTLPPSIYDEDEPEGEVFRWMSALVVVLAIAGFFGLAWYAYRNGGDTVDEKDVELIKAEPTPVKETPANPGGMQIPNQDKTVYGLISGGKTEKPVVERILPAPEEPISRSGDTETWMSDSVKNKSKGAVETVKAPESPPASAQDAAASSAPKEQYDPAKIRALEAAKSSPATTQMAALTPSPAAPAAPAPSASAPLHNPPPPAAPAPPVPASPAPAAAVKTPPAAVPASAADDSDDSDDDQKAAAQPDAKPVSAAPPAGIRIQLGAYKSQGEADSNWKKIAHDFSDDLQGKQHYIVRADLGGKGTYYRLQVAPFASSSDAEQFCLDFVSAGQGCFLAKGK